MILRALSYRDVPAARVLKRSFARGNLNARERGLSAVLGHDRVNCVVFVV
mgnify:CR=1 FL=1